MVDAVFVYITTGSTDEAQTIGVSLVEARLAACANIIDGMRSIYRWNDEIREDRETILIVKTRESLVDELVAWVKEIHSYECPCIVALPVKGGNGEFLEWIAQETGEANAS